MVAVVISGCEMKRGVGGATTENCIAGDDGCCE